ncbi:unnamed protein product [Brassica rapa subsp. narinosa]
MSQGISGNARPTIFNRGTVRDGCGEVVQEIEFVAHSVDPAEANAYWVAMCNVEEPHPEPWVPMRPFSERVVGRPSSTQPHSSFSGRFVHRLRPSPWWSAVLGSFLSREGPCGGRGSSISFQLIN